MSQTVVIIVLESVGQDLGRAQMGHTLFHGVGQAHSYIYGHLASQLRARQSLKVSVLHLLIVWAALVLFCVLSPPRQLGVCFHAQSTF